MKVYIVVDMQNDFIDMALGTKEAALIVQPMIKYLSSLPSSSYIVATRDTHQENYLDTNEGKYLPIKHCIEGSRGWEICDALKDTIKFNKVVNKSNFGISAEKWRDILGNDVEEITLMGLCTDICVVSNALALKVAYPDIKISVKKDLCAGVTVDSHNAALITMAMCQVEII